MYTHDVWLQPRHNLVFVVNTRDLFEPYSFIDRPAKEPTITRARLKEEVVSWLDENEITYMAGFQFNRESGTGWRLSFEREDDLTLFKLRWM